MEKKDLDDEDAMVGEEQDTDSSTVLGLTWDTKEDLIGFAKQSWLNFEAKKRGVKPFWARIKTVSDFKSYVTKKTGIHKITSFRADQITS